MLILFLFTLFYLVPGYVFYSLFRTQLKEYHNPEDLIWFSTISGLFFNLILFLIFSVLKLSLFLGFLFEIIVIVFLIVILIIKYKHFYKHTWNILKRSDQILLIAVCFSILLLSLKKGDIANDLHYLAPATRSLAEGYFVNKMFYLNNDIFDPTISFNPFNQILVLLSSFSGYSLLKVWRNLPMIWVPLSMISVYSFSTKLFNDKNIARTILIIFILHFSGVLYNFMGFALFTRTLPVCLYILMPFFWYAFINFDQRKSKVDILVFVIINILLFLFNPFYWILGILGIAGYYFFNLILYPKKNIIKIPVKLGTLSYLILLISPFFLFKLIAFSTPNPTYFDYKTIIEKYFISHSAIYLSLNSFIIHPKMIFGMIYSLTGINYTPGQVSPLIGVIASLFIIFNKNIKSHIKFLFTALTFTPILIGFNPILVPLLSKMISFVYVQRIGMLIPFIYSIGFAIYHLINLINKHLKKFSRWIYIGFGLILFIVSFNNISFNIRVISNEILGRKNLYDNLGVIDEIERLNINRKTFFADPVLSYYISTLSNNFVYTIYSLNSNPNDPTTLQREKNYYSIINNTDPEAVYCFFKENHIDYIIIVPEEMNHPLKNEYPLNLPELYYYFYQDIQYGTLYQTVNDSKNYEQVWTDNHFIIYMVN